MPEPDLKELAGEIAVTFGLEPTGRKQTAEEFRDDLAGFLAELMANNPEYLFQVLYRMDVDEFKVNRLLEKFPVSEFAMHLADLVLERQMERIKTRKAYGNRHQAEEGMEF